MYRVFLIGMRTLCYFALCAEFDLWKCQAVFQILASDHERVVCVLHEKGTSFCKESLLYRN